MDNKQFPEQDEPMKAPVPAEEETPMIEDIPISGALPTEQLSLEEAPAEELPVEEIPFKDAPNEEIPGEEPAPMEEAPLLVTPEIETEILPDHHAMDAHGMLEHGEVEEPFDMSILDDPEFQIPVVQQTPSQEELSDQQYSDQSAASQTTSAEAVKKTLQQIYDRKGRPKKKGGDGLLGIPHILVTVVWLVLILAIGVTLGRMLWVCAADVLAFGREDREVTIAVYESDTLEDITEKLHKNGLIRYKSLFNFYAEFSDAMEDIDPGIYDLNTRYDYHALVNMMSASSQREIVEIMIPEGYTCRQIFETLESYKVCFAIDLAAYAASGELDEYWFLEGVERGDGYCLEGFLFPDTYQFYTNDSAENVLEKMLDNFEYRYSEELKAQIANLNDHISGLMRDNGRSEEYIAEHLFDVRDVVTVASIIEKETANNSESPTIASVIYNRLFNWGSTPAYLNIDASIIYAQGGNADVIDTSIDSPYNTYTNTGLTPTPISNPGLSSIQAALSPETTGYYFYVLNPSAGVHSFSTTQEEHDALIDEYY